MLLESQAEDDTKELAEASGTWQDWALEGGLDPLRKCIVSLIFCGTILVMGTSSIKAVSKHVFGGRKFLMIAVGLMLALSLVE